MNDNSSEAFARLVGCDPDAPSGAFIPDRDAFVARIGPATFLERLAAVRHAAHDASSLMENHEAARLTWLFSGLTADRAALDYALSEWNEAPPPVHDLIAFDFASGAMTTRGLAWFCGQEVRVAPEEALRTACAHLMVQLAREILQNGGYPATVRAKAPDMPRGEVLLQVTPGWVEIVPYAS